MIGPAGFMQAPKTATQRDRELSAKIAEADHRGNDWLAKARLAEERGNKKRAEECYRKGQYWLDRSNKLRGEC